MFKQISRLSILSLLLLGLLASITPVNANTIVPVATGIIPTFTSSASNIVLTFTVKNLGDILVASVTNINNGPCNNHHPTITDSQVNIWTVAKQDEGQSDGTRATSDVWTTTASASGSNTVTVAFTSCSNYGAGATIYDLVGYTLTGLQTSSLNGASGTTTSVNPNIVVSTPNAIIGAFAGYSFRFPVTTTDALFFTEYADPNAAGDFGVNGAGYGGSLVNGGYVGNSAFVVSDASYGAAFSNWSESVIALPQVSATTTVTSTTTSTTTATTTQTTTTTRVGVIIQTTTQNGLPTISSPSLLGIIIVTIIVMGLITAALFLSGLGRKGRR